MKRIKSLLTNKMIQDGVLSIGSKGIFFFVWKFMIEPWMNARMGEAAFGNYVVVLGYVSILAYSCGEALNHIRVLNQETDHDRAAEYRIVAIVEAFFSFVILFIYSLFVEKSTIASALMLGTVTALMLLRLYVECMFRIEINYKKILISSVLMAAGYLSGYLLFRGSLSWYWIFIAGESLAVIYAAVSGGAFHAESGVSDHFFITVKNVGTLTASYLISYALVYMDRFLVKFLLNESLVSIYYISTTYGKVVALVIPPITSVLLSNISKGTIQLNKKMVNRVVAGSIGAIAFFFAVGMPVSRLIVLFLYPSSYQECLSVMDIGNLAQIVYYSCSIVNMMAIRLCDMKLQVKVETTYAFSFILFAIIGAKMGGLVGLAIGTLLANILRFLMLTIPVYRMVRRESS